MERRSKPRARLCLATPPKGLVPLESHDVGGMFLTPRRKITFRKVYLGVHFLFLKEKTEPKEKQQASYRLTTPVLIKPKIHTVASPTRVFATSRKSHGGTTGVRVLQMNTEVKKSDLHLLPSPFLP